MQENFSKTTTMKRRIVSTQGINPSSLLVSDNYKDEYSEQQDLDDRIKERIRRFKVGRM